MQKTQHNDQTQAHSTKNIVHTCIPTSYNLGTECDVKMYLHKDFFPLIDFFFATSKISKTCSNAATPPKCICLIMDLHKLNIAKHTIMPCSLLQL